MHFTIYKTDVTVSCSSPFIQTSSHIGFNNNYNRRIFRITVSKIALNGTGKRAYAGLYKYVGGAVTAIFCSCSLASMAMVP
jgi:hypothetical protein